MYLFVFIIFHYNVLITVTLYNLFVKESMNLCYLYAIIVQMNGFIYYFYFIVFLYLDMILTVYYFSISFVFSLRNQILVLS